ncbi:MAG: septation protein IspZ [Hyphomonadaceae bacterium]|nr:septation protein IspZ [Hyphomonadaceae bacterium]
MSEDLTALDTAKPRRQSGANQLLIDLGPIVVYVVAFNVLQRIESLRENAVYIATGVFMAATIAALAYSWVQARRVPPVLVVTAVLVLAFGGLTIALHDSTFIQVKPTFTYLFYVAAIVFSLAIRQNVWKLLFRHAFNLPDRIWNILALRWAAFFAFQAVLNEVIRYYYNEANGNFDVWLNSRPFVVFPLVLAFAAINTPFVLKHHREDEEPAPAPPNSGA